MITAQLQSFTAAETDFIYLTLSRKIFLAFSIAFGSCIDILPPNFTSLFTSSTLAESRMSSVSGLNAIPKTAIFSPLIFPMFCLINSIMLPICCLFVFSTAVSKVGFTPVLVEKSIIALTSFGKQEPPYPGPASRNSLPIRGSNPIVLDTSSISASGIFSQILAI